MIVEHEICSGSIISIGPFWKLIQSENIRKASWSGVYPYVWVRSCGRFTVVETDIDRFTIHKLKGDQVVFVGDWWVGITGGKHRTALGAIRAFEQRKSK